MDYFRQGRCPLGGGRKFQADRFKLSLLGEAEAPIRLAVKFWFGDSTWRKPLHLGLLFRLTAGRSPGVHLCFSMKERCRRNLRTCFHAGLGTRAWALTTRVTKWDTGRRGEGLCPLPPHGTQSDSRHGVTAATAACSSPSSGFLGSKH